MKSIHLGQRPLESRNTKLSLFVSRLFGITSLPPPSPPPFGEEERGLKCSWTIYTVHLNFTNTTLVFRLWLMNFLLLKHEDDKIEYNWAIVIKTPYQALIISDGTKNFTKIHAFGVNFRLTSSPRMRVILALIFSLLFLLLLARSLYWTCLWESLSTTSTA